ncbi:MAG: glycosyltransferase family 2 protein [Candidatus Shapirobacteria bacterium]
MNFSVVIPNYNGALFISDCLNSLINSIKEVKNVNFEIILVDNNSKDNSIEISKEIFKKIKIIQNSKNFGFAGAVNQGIRKAKYEWVILLNNDLTFEKNWFEKVVPIIKENKDPKVATFFGTVLIKDGTKFESQGLEFFYSGKAQNISNGKTFNKSTIYDLKSNISVWGASAALVIYNKDILNRIGLFDEDFFAYEEDVDLALRLHNLNYKTLYIPSAISYHLGGGTSNKMRNIRSRLSFRNWFFVIIKNYSSKEILDNFLEIFIERIRNLSYFLRETIKIYKIKALIIFPFDFLKTLIEILVKIPKTLRKRKQIQKLAKLSI